MKTWPTIVLLSLAIGCARGPYPDRAPFVGSLFTGAEQSERFGRLDEVFPTNPVFSPKAKFTFARGEEIALPSDYAFKKERLGTASLLTETDTVGLLVVKDDEIRFEHYYLGASEETRWLSMSVAKSFISALLGIAIEEGLIQSIEEPVTKYVPSLAGSAYDGVRIKDILQMSSGARWNEDYSDPESDIGRFGRVFATGGSLNEFAATLEREREPGTFNLYNSTDTQVLGMLLTNVTGKTIASYMQDELWQPLGMEYDAYWLTDDTGSEMAFGGLNATLRDYAKLGRLYLNDGYWEGQQIVPEAWVKASTTPDAPHLMPGENPQSDFPMGYGYQWWIMDGDDSAYSAIGVYNQFIYVNPTQNVVIVKLSANSDYATSLDESAYREIETIALFRAIEESLR
jgi:CubicO group peptidase (beta-lactamase class C family)